MTSIPATGVSLEHTHARRASILSYVFSVDHKIIGIQFLFSALIWMLVGGLLALAMRWQLAWPWTDMPIIGRWLFGEQAGQISPDFYNALFTMHGTVMTFLVIIPLLTGAFGNYLIPLMIGAPDMAFPRLNAFSYWVMWPAFACIVLSWGAAAGWTSYPPLALTLGDAQTWWLLSITLVGISSLAGSINYITTVIAMRAPGMTWMRMPLTVWGLFVTAIIQSLALPVLTAGGVMQLSDRLAGTDFFAGGGQPLLWQHLFWFYSHPAVYVMILPAMGIISDVISCFARKPLFGYVPMVIATAAIGGLGFLVWGHHMFTSGMNPAVGMVFALATLLIAVPSAIKTFNWIATLWGGSIHFTTPMLFAISFVSMFIIGGLSGIFLGASVLDIFLHDTYFIVAHFHYVLFGGSVMAIFAGIYYWYPKMFGRMMNETLGKWHFVLTFIFFNATFFPMHFLGLMGFPRRVADVALYESLNGTPPINAFITISAIGMGLAQLLFAANFFGSLFGRKTGANPWHANTLEWTTPSPPPHGNFVTPVRVYRGPYEYSVPGEESDYLPQSQAP